MNKNQASEHLVSIGYWSEIESSGFKDNMAYFTAYDNDQDRVLLMVELNEDDEFVVYECYEGGIWSIVDLP